MEKRNENILGYIFAAVAVFLWGITFVCTKSLLNDFSAFEILFFRFLAAYIGLWIIKPKRLVLKNKKENWWFFLAGLSGIAVYQQAENIAINYTTASNVSIIVSICPFFTAIIAQIFLKEKHLNLWFILGFIIALAGITLVSFNGHAEFHLSPKGDLLALLAAVSWGFYSLFVSKVNAMGYDDVLCTRRFFFYALILMIPFFIYGATCSEPGSAFYVNLSAAINKARFAKPMSWVNLLFLGLGASAFCFVAWGYACNKLGTVKITVALYLIPVITIVFAFIFLGETITLMGLCGAALTITGLILSGRKRK